MITKKQANLMKLCSMACGAYSNSSGTCEADRFQGRNEQGDLVTVPSIYCRLKPEDIEIMKREYGYNHQSNQLTKYRGNI
jgi:hypothetical protein